MSARSHRLRLFPRPLQLLLRLLAYSSLVLCVQGGFLFLIGFFGVFKDVDELLALVCVSLCTKGWEERRRTVLTTLPDLLIIVMCSMIMAVFY